MSVLDTFYLIFKTDAKGASNDVKNLDRQISELAAKGKQRSEAESKQLQELRKQRQEVTRDLKDERKAVEETGGAYAKMFESLAVAGGAYLSFAALKSGVLNAADFNRQISIQSQIMGVNTREMKAYAYAVEQAGGTVGGFQSALQAAFGAASSAGLPLPGVDTLMRRYHAAIRGMSPSGKANYLAQLGVSDPGLVRLLESSDEEFERRIRQGKEHAEVTRQQAKAADEFAESWSRATQSIDQMFSVVSGDVLPAVTKVLDKFSDLAPILKESKVETYGAFGALSGILAGKGVGSVVRWLGGKASDPSSADARGGHKAAMDFWISRGYTREQAAVIVANEQAESGGDPRAVGDGGTSFGLFQWHDPARRDRILKNTGIDVKTASAEDQRKAAAWELEATGIGPRLRDASGIDQASAIFTRDFENPADWRGQSVRRARMALDIAGSAPFNASSSGGSTASVKIDQINVHTQATDAAGISAAIGQELNSHLRSAMSNIDDGVAY